METKKNPQISVHKKQSLFLAIGLIISLGITYLAFEWKQFESPEVMDLGMATDDFEELTEIPPTEQLPPPKPIIQQPKIVDIPDDEEIKEDISFDLDVEITEKTEIENLVFEDEPIKEEADQFFTFVEEEASFPGGNSAWIKYLNDNIEYPRQAQRMGREGRVFLLFSVDKTGQISDIEVMRGIGGGCNEEAIRVLKSSPRWNPGKQRGVPVNSKMRISILFRLR